MTNSVHAPAASGGRAPGDAMTGGPVVSGPVTVIPIHRGKRVIGAFIVSEESARFEPSIDVTPISVTALGVAAVIGVAVALVAATRHPSAIRSVTMGPGGWVSFKGATLPPLRGTGKSARPWWARILRARRLVVQQ